MKILHIVSIISTKLHNYNLVLSTVELDSCKYDLTIWCLLARFGLYYRLSNRPALGDIVPRPALTLVGTPFVPLSKKIGVDYCARPTAASTKSGACTRSRYYVAGFPGQFAQVCSWFPTLQKIGKKSYFDFFRRVGNQTMQWYTYIYTLMPISERVVASKRSAFQFKVEHDGHSYWFILHIVAFGWNLQPMITFWRSKCVSLSHRE